MRNNRQRIGVAASYMLLYYASPKPRPRHALRGPVQREPHALSIWLAGEGVS